MNKERVAKWDNIRFFMMASVVIGHSIYNYIGSATLAKAFYLFIYSFHIPVFMFVAGLFSKNAVKLRKYERVIEYIVIYMVMKFLECFADYLAYGKIRFHFFWEDGPAWFALAMAVFLLVTMFLQDYDRGYIMAAAIVIGCLAGLDTHLGDHMASMRICVFYPVFLAGYYLDPEIFQQKKQVRKANTFLWKDWSVTTTVLAKLCSFLFLNIILMITLLDTEALWPMIKLLKGKYTYQEMGLGMVGICARLLCYIFWICTILAVVIVNAEKKHIFSWLGRRTMSIFIWHNLFLVIFFKVLGGKVLFKNSMPHTYVFGAICMGIIVSILTAYLPSLRMPAKTSALHQWDGREGNPGRRS